MTYPGFRNPMRRTQAMPIAGYFDKLSGRAGETLALKASAETDAPVQAELLHLHLGDANPAAGGMKATTLADLGAFEGRHQPIDLGSHAALPAIALPDAARFSLRVQPWLLRGTPSVLGHAEGWEISATEDAVIATVGDIRLTLDVRLRRKVWYEITLAADSATGEAILGVRGLTAVERQPDPVDVRIRAGGTPGLRTGPVRLAARPATGGLHEAHFNGRLEDPRLDAGMDGTGGLLAFWDFSDGITTQRLTDRGPSEAHGHVVNVPTRAMRGSLWTGAVMKWTEEPRHYAAIHFHEDDLYDCGWETSLEVTIPDDLASGIYAVRLTQGPHSDTVPFYVLSGDERRNRICFLASTYTYQCYANYARGNLDAALRARMADWDTPRHNPDDYDLYGFSVYNFHPDGSGHHFSSRLRPMMTMRPGFLTFCDPKGSGIRHFPADTHLTHWLERTGQGFDVVTDEDLDREGVDLIAGYDVVLTGSHPEYHTTGTMDALAAYQQQGGNFCYLGGNGFYWRVERNDALPGMLELRRAELGMRAWGTDVAENYHQLAPSYGGLWRRAGRPPQVLCGLGFTAQGLFTGSHYRLDPAARDSPAAHLLEGITGPILGDYGLNGGGAAGFELDRADVELGTPETFVRLAVSEGHDSDYSIPPEDVLSPGKSMTGEPTSQMIRSDVIWYRTPAGGQVFSVGSIFFCGALLVNETDNDISRLLTNVLGSMLG
ncbi:N,N-dimethylformamidase beta subunit family domain-containing protein [Mesobacterium pallidum]|uniref:N,N-dimethylformamidase beta subunit family domain-containing protein n=1 Tax=Mesobacterium pallidum TaxID=2872037 RepID=UPI001EE37BFF|nr:N,N-dimethylformamidase beta subunit family domain-containing protein [Mesobacterium pallidum]